MKWLLLCSTRYYDAEKEGGSDKTPAQIEREKIKVTTSRQTEQPEKTKTEDDDKGNDKEGTEESDEEGKDDGEEGDESGESETKEGETELTEDQKQIKKLEKTIARLQKRVGRTAAEKDQIKKDLTTATASLNAKVEAGEGLTEEEVERRAEAKATAKVDAREFDNAQKKLVKAAIKADKDFMGKVNEMAQDVAPIPPFMIGALDDMDNGGAVLAYLAQNPDEYEELFTLPPPKMIRALDKIGIKLEEAGRPRPRQISRVPAPIDPTKGGSESPNLLPEKPNKDAASMEKFVKLRAQQVEARRKQKLGMS